MKIPAIIVLLVFAAWCFFCATHWYPCEVIAHKEAKYAGICDASLAVQTDPVEQEVNEETAELKKPDFLSFEWSSDELSIPDNFDEVKADLLGFLESDSLNLVEIVGLYSKTESNSTGFANLGLARAEKIKMLFDEGNQGRLSIRGVPYSFSDAVEYLKAIRFNKVNSGSQFVELMVFDDKSVIRFPLGAEDYLSSPDLERHLQRLAENLAGTSSSLLVEGHTDNQGDPSMNMELGLRRAEAIKAQLMLNGATDDQIETSSLGEEKPIDDNATEEGRRNNRRVEIIKR